MQISKRALVYSAVQLRPSRQQERDKSGASWDRGCGMQRARLEEKAE